MNLIWVIFNQPRACGRCVGDFGGMSSTTSFATPHAIGRDFIDQVVPWTRNILQWMELMARRTGRQHSLPSAPPMNQKSQTDPNAALRVKTCSFATTISEFLTRTMLIILEDSMCLYYPTLFRVKRMVFPTRPDRLTFNQIDDSIGELDAILLIVLTAVIVRKNAKLYTYTQLSTLLYLFLGLASR